MSHFKKYSEHRHGRAVAKQRVRQSGGKVINFPISGLEENRNRLASSQGVQSGRIPKVSSDNTVAGPGRFPGTGGIKPSVIRRMSGEDMPHAKGGRVKMTGGAESGMGRLERAKQAMRKRK